MMKKLRKMMPQLLGIITLGLLLYAWLRPLAKSDQHVIFQDSSIEEGVPLEMARMRRAALDSVHYDLEVAVPGELSQPVTGVCHMRFTLSHLLDMPLDYCGQEEGTQIPVTINGCKETLTIKAQHIVLPVQLLHEGSNEVTLPFTCSDKTLNRHEDYLYTLFVPANARSTFPCLDQPDIKATFNISMQVPQGWTTMHSAASHPIPTYLFSFVAGRFNSRTARRDGRDITILYRETDVRKVAQIDDILDMAALSIKWMEEYTGVAYPFEYYNLVVLPGYQFGGMEHPGAIQLNDRTIFLPEHPTPSEELKRFNLIAHETAHIWFGDLVTMRWFDDVWTKEVFAGFLADKISRERFPDINHDLNFISNHFPASLATDRTDGTHPIGQQLDNLNQAGLLYGNIIYHKAPIMMRKIEERMGEERLRQALRRYVHRYAYHNATWDELIAIMDSVAPEAGIRDFDCQWVKTAGIPEALGGELLEDMPYAVIDLEKLPAVEQLSGDGVDKHVAEVRRMMHDINYNENLRRGHITAKEAFTTLAQRLQDEDNVLIASNLAGYLCGIHERAPLEMQATMDGELMRLALEHSLPPVRLQLKRHVYRSVVNAELLPSIEKIWKAQDDTQLSRNDYTSIAYHLALMLPEHSDSILSLQRSRLETDDERLEFDFIARACTPDTVEQRILFQGLIEPGGRLNEPWARSMLALLCDKTREQQACRYILPGLDRLEYIQRTSDIFFPGYWLHGLLGARTSKESLATVKGWIESHPDYPPLLLRKVKEESWR